MAEGDPFKLMAGWLIGWAVSDKILRRMKQKMKPFLLRVGLGQLNPTVGDFEENKRKVLDFIQQAEEKGLDLVVFPELSLCGYPIWDLANKKQFVAASLNALHDVARFTHGKQAAAVVGFVDKGRSGTGKSRNALAFIQGGRVRHVQHKTLLPTYDVFLEAIYFEAGAQHRVFSFKGMEVGTTICEDIWDDHYPVKPAKIFREKGASLLINISASPFHRTVAEVRDRLIRQKSRDNRMWIIYVNQVGGQDDLVFDGRSLVADPHGRIVFRADAFDEGLFCAELPIPDGGQDLPLGEVSAPAEMYRALTLGIRDYVQKNGFRKVVVGLSGGIDSAVVATLAADALGPEAVVGVTMPGAYSSRGSYEDSEALAKNLGIELRRRPIVNHYRRFLVQAKDGRAGKASGHARHKITLAMENLQARLRALELMYISNDENCLVLSTGNKSELAMGYCTLYGDMCGGLCVLGDVYKTDVYRIARYRNGLSQVIPSPTLKKAPSAELRPNQKDQDSLPPYEKLDKILYNYIEKNMSEGEILNALKSAGTPKRMIAEVIRKVDRNEYKRRQAPPIIRVTEKAWFGRRMPITNHFL